MNIAIIGAGLIGTKRAANLPKEAKLLYVCDVNLEKAQKLAGQYSALALSDWKKIIVNQNIDAVIIATTPNFLVPVATASTEAGIHVLIEKPGARNIKEFQKIIKAHKKNPVVVMFGYNHRYHPAIQKAKQIISAGFYGPLLFIRARYGHGGRLGYEKEWRFDPEIAGGGELLDQGSHLIDLVNFFAGPMTIVNGFVSNLFWKSKLEDAAFFQLKNKKNQFAHLCATALEWKNLFSFEIMLKKAKLQINGLGGSYGPEILTVFKMKPEMGPPAVENFQFPLYDQSWIKETQEFFNRIEKKDTSVKNILDAKYVLETVDKIYKQNNK